MKILLFGYRDAGAFCLEHLIRHNENVVGVVVPPEDNGIDCWCRSVRKLALEHELLVLDPGKLRTKEFSEKVKSLNPDLIFSCYYPKIIPEAILNIPVNGGINFHGGLLPNYRGCFSGVWSIINDERESGVTMHYMEPQIDVGEIIAIKKVNISNEDTSLSLYQKVMNATVSLFQEKYFLLKRYGELPSIPQEKSVGNYYGRQLPFNGIIDWGKHKRGIYNFIRALYFPPFKPAFTLFRDKELLIWGAKEITASRRLRKGIPGEIVAIDMEGPIVATIDGHIIINKAGFEMDDNNLSASHNLIKNKIINIGDILK